MKFPAWHGDLEYTHERFDFIPNRNNRAHFPTPFPRAISAPTASASCHFASFLRVLRILHYECLSLEAIAPLWQLVAW